MSLKLNEFLLELRNKAAYFEQIDINGIEEKSFIKRNIKTIICSVISTVIVYNLDNGFSSNFITYSSTVLSILVGLFITALIFSFDKFYATKAKKETSKDKLWDTQAYNYSKQFAYITGYNIVLCIYVLLLVAISSLFEDFMSLNIFDYYLDLQNITFSSLLTLGILLVVLFQRFFVIYWILSIMYNTLFIVSSMVNFMIARIDRNEKA